MLNQQDLKAISKIVRSEVKNEIKPVQSDISAMEARMADIESSGLTRVDRLRLETYLTRIEKRLTSLEGRMLNSATKKDVKGLKKSLKSLETRLMNKINDSIDALDSNIVDTQKRVDRIDKHLNISSLSVV